MKDTKLHRLFYLLSNEELKQIQKMVKSPYFTTNLNVAKLFKLLRPHHPDFESKAISKQNIYKKIFRNEKYSDIKLRKLFSELSSVIEEFIIQKELSDNHFEKKKILLNGFIKRKSNGLFEKEEKKMRVELEKIPFRDEIFFKDNYDVEILLSEFIGSKDFKKRLEVLKKSYEDLELYYQISKAKIKNDLISLSGYVNTDLSFLEEKTYTKNIVIDLYSKLELMYSSDDVKIIFEVKELLEENLSQIRKPLQLEIILTLINFSIKQMKVEDVTFNDVVLDLYKFGLDKNIIIQNNSISENTFLNIAVTGSKSGDYDWVEDFIKDNEKYLNENSREGIFRLGQAYLAFHKKEFQEVIRFAGQCDFNLPLHDLVARSLILRSYYELFLLNRENYDLTIAFCDSFEKWIRRNKLVSNSTTKSVLNYISIVKKLTIEKLNGKFDISDQKKFLDLISNHNITIARSWLIEKVTQ